MATPPVPTTMRAWQYTYTQGGLEKNLTLNTAAPLPPHDAKTLGQDKVLVRVLAASLNPVDYKLPELPVVGRLAIKKPASPGIDFAGRVAATGAGDLAPSTLVFGRLDAPGEFGTLAEYTVARRQALAVVPEGISAEDAACVGTAGLTAYQSIIPNVKRGEGKKVFINGGSGGTGIWGIQIAKAVGCYVVTSCSGRNVELCRSLGADEVIDYTSEDVVQALKQKTVSTSHENQGKFDLIVDNVGMPEALYQHCHEFTTPEAKYVQVGLEVSWQAVRSVVSRIAWPGFLGGGQRGYQVLTVHGDAAELEEIGKWMQERKVKAVSDEVFPMEDAPKAFLQLKTKRARGKIVVAVGDGKN